MRTSDLTRDALALVGTALACMGLYLLVVEIVCLVHR
jgi:hypothetical protein